MTFAKRNIILSTDSYKLSMWNQYPPGTEVVYSYIESRGSDIPEYEHEIVNFGLQAYIRETLMKPVTMEDIDEAEAIIKAHGEPFYREGWEYIVKQHGGYLPVRIRSLDEGLVIEPKTVMLTIENTDPKCFWLTTHLETSLLRAIWYPSTVATNSFHSRKLIKQFLEETGDPAGLPFKLHDFGARGVSSSESAMLGGMSHLATGAMGTDTIEGILGAMRYYDSGVCAYSIPAMEHSTVTSWGREGEAAAFRNMMKHYAKPGALLAAVSDSYDIYNATENIWGKELKDEVIKSGAIVVVRPDSGDPATVVTGVVRKLDAAYGSTINAKGFRVLNNVRVIQGDGIDTASIRGILNSLKWAGYSADNVAFGQGGALLQQVNRDTLKFAMKCSWIRVGNKGGRDVYKQPAGEGAEFKVSKKGRFVVHEENGQYVTKDAAFFVDNVNPKNLLALRYENGIVYNETIFEEVRARVAEKL